MSIEEIQQLRESLDDMGKERHDREGENSGEYRGYSKEELEGAREELA